MVLLLELLASSVLQCLGLLALLFCFDSHDEHSSSSYESLAESVSTTRTPILLVRVCMCVFVRAKITEHLIRIPL